MEKISKGGQGGEEAGLLKEVAVRKKEAQESPRARK